MSFCIVNEERIATGQTVHSYVNTTYQNNVQRGKLENKNMERRELDLTYFSWNF